MTTLTDLLLELRAIRIGNQMILRKVYGTDIDLLEAAELEQRGGRVLSAPQREPRDHKAILHRNDQRELARNILREGGDDTESILAFLGEQYGTDVAMNVRQFYEEEIVGGKR